MYYAILKIKKDGDLKIKTLPQCNFFVDSSKFRSRKKKREETRRTSDRLRFGTKIITQN